MTLKRIIICAKVFAMVAVAGCASYRVSSNVAPTTSMVSTTTAPVVVLENSPPDRQYTVVGPIEVSVKKLTVFHEDPTKEQADAALVERARALGADAVINVSYESGIGFTTWGYIDAKGTAVKFVTD